MVEKNYIKAGVVALSVTALIVGLSVGLTKSKNNKSTTSSAASATYDAYDIDYSASSGSSIRSTKSSKASSYSGSAKSGKSTSKSSKSGEKPIVDVCDVTDFPLPSGSVPTLKVGSVTAGTNVGGPTVPGGSCGTFVTNNANVAWYTVIGTGNTMTASTCNDDDPSTGSADYDTKISILCGCGDTSDTSGKCIMGSDDNSGCGGFSTSLSWETTAGETYYIMVHGFSGETGTFDLSILDDGIPSTSKYNACNPSPVGAPIIRSDGTQERPYCSWNGACENTPENDQECAEALCQASGYASGTFISKSNDYCNSSVETGQNWYWEIDVDQYVFAGKKKEAIITAKCTGALDVSTGECTIVFDLFG